MNELFKGIDGKYAIITFGVLGIGFLTLCGYSIHHGYSLSISNGNAQFTLFKNNTVGT